MREQEGWSRGWSGCWARVGEDNDFYPEQDNEGCIGTYIVPGQYALSCSG